MELYGFFISFLTADYSKLAQFGSTGQILTLEKPAFQVILTCTIEIGTLLAHSTRNQLLFESMVQIQAPLKYQIQRAFAQRVVEEFRRPQFSGLNKIELLHGLMQNLASDWIDKIGNDECSADTREEVYQVLVHWAKISSRLFSNTSLVFKMLERFNKIIEQNSQEPLECYTIAFLVGSMASRSGLSLNFDKAPYEDLCEVTLALIQENEHAIVGVLAREQVREAAPDGPRV